MRPRRIRLAVAAMAAGLLVAAHCSGAVVLAQDATPPAGEAVPASECTVVPRPIGFLGALVSTPVSGEPHISPTAVPEGTTVDPATATEIEAAVRMIVACANSGDALRALALLSDDYLHRTVDPTGELDPETANELAETFATPVAIQPEHLVTLIGIRAMVALPDGSVAVVVESDGGSPNPDGTDVDLFILAKIDGRWLITDAVNDIDDLDVAAASS